MEASRDFSRTPRRLPPCSDVSVLQKTRMSHFWDTHHTAEKTRNLAAIERSSDLVESYGHFSSRIGRTGVSKSVHQRGEYVVVGFIERARQAGGRRRPVGGHRSLAGGQLGGGGTGYPQPPGQPDARQRVGGQGARRYNRGAGRRRAGRTTTGTFAFLLTRSITFTKV